MPVLSGCDGLYASRGGVCCNALHSLPKETPEGGGAGAQLLARRKQCPCRGLPVLGTQPLVKTVLPRRPGWMLQA